MLSFSTSPSFIMVNSVVGNSLPKGIALLYWYGNCDVRGFIRNLQGLMSEIFCIRRSHQWK